MIFLIPIQTSWEEYVFRGYLMQGFATLFRSRWGALLLTSFVFGSLHLFNPEVEKLGYGVMIYYIGTGLFLGILTLMDEGIELALGFHAANNLTTALLVTSSWTAFQTESGRRANCISRWPHRIFWCRKKTCAAPTLFAPQRQCGPLSRHVPSTHG